MVVFQHPVRPTAQCWKTGVRGIARLLAERGAELGHVAERLEVDVCHRMIAKGILGFAIDSAGRVTEGIAFPPPRMLPEAEIVPPMGM